MNKLNLASKRELNPFWIFFPCFFAKGDVYLWAVLSLEEMMGYFLACSLETAQIPPAVQVKSFTKQGQQRRICKDLPLKTRKNGLPPGMRTCFLYNSGSFHVLVGGPQNGHRLCHCARNIVLSFMLLLLLLNYDM